MSENRQLGDGVELVWEANFLPNRNWSIRRGDLVWSRVEGWRKHYGVKRSDTHFETAQDAMKVWEQRGKVEPTS